MIRRLGEAAIRVGFPAAILALAVPLSSWTRPVAAAQAAAIDAAAAIQHPLAEAPLPNPYGASNTSDWTRSPRNQIVAAVDRGSGGRRETWIATAAGVKCADYAHRIMRHYTVRDGLAYDTILAIYADSDGVWCLCSDGRSTSLCSLDGASGHWRILRTDRTKPWADRPDYFGQSQFDQSIEQAPVALLAGSPRWIAFATQAVDYRADAIVRLLDKRTGTVANIPWDPAMRADNNVLGPIVAHFQNDDVLWMGTSLGLLRWSRKDQRWTRYLADESVVDFAIRGDAIWAVGQPRRPPSGANTPELPAWKLARVSAGDGSVQQWTPDPAPPLPVRPATGASDAAIPWQPIRNQLRPAALDLSSDLPVAVAIAPDGIVWTSHISHVRLDDSYPLAEMSGGPGRPQTGGFERFDPASKRWTQYPLHFISEGGKRSVVIGGDGDKGAISPSEAPEDAVRPLAIRKIPYLHNGAYYPKGDFFWIRQRYPEWICLESSGDPKTGDGETQHP